MESGNKSVNRSETIISSGIIALLIIIFVIIFVKQSYYDISRFGISKSISEDAGRDFDISLIAPEGFEPLKKPETYNSETLFEKIDGKAPLYLQSGFLNLYTVSFIKAGEKKLWMEVYIYDMSNIRGAFSVYSLQVRPDALFLPETSNIYMTDNALYLVHGRYYVEIIGSMKNSDLTQAVLEVSGRIKKYLKVKGDTDLIEKSFFDKNLTRPGSIKLYLSNAFGFKGFSDIFSAEYLYQGKTAGVFFSKKLNPENARETAESYVKFLVDNGGQAEKRSPKGELFYIIDLYGAYEAVFTQGSFVAGVHEADKQALAESLSSVLMKNLKEAENIK